MADPPARVAIALGSNLGDRAGHINWAIGQLGGLLADLRASPAIETAPVDVPDQQPPYLNAVVVGETTLAPPALLEALLGIERERGRVRTGRRAARTLDLDLILYGDLQCDLPGLTLPHPRYRERQFVLGLLADLVPDWVDPVTRRALGDLAVDAGWGGSQTKKGAKP